MIKKTQQLYTSPIKPPSYGPVTSVQTGDIFSQMYIYPTLIPGRLSACAVSGGMSEHCLDEILFNQLNLEEWLQGGFSPGRRDLHEKRKRTSPSSAVNHHNPPGYISRLPARHQGALMQSPTFLVVYTNLSLDSFITAFHISFPSLYKPFSCYFTTAWRMRQIGMKHRVQSVAIGRIFIFPPENISCHI